MTDADVKMIASMFVIAAIFDEFSSLLTVSSSSFEYFNIVSMTYSPAFDVSFLITFFEIFIKNRT